MSSLKQAAIVIATRNRPQEIRLLCHHLSELRGSKPTHLVVSDSSDELIWLQNQSALEDVAGTFSIHHLKALPGLPRQKNIAIDYLSSGTDVKTVFILDDDVLPEDCYFEIGSDLHSNLPEDSLIFGVENGSRFRTQNRIGEWLGLGFGKEGSITKGGFGVPVNSNQDSETISCTWAPGGAQVMRLSLAQTVRFSEPIRLYGEDLDFCLRLKRDKPNAQIVCSQALKFRHTGSKSQKVPVAVEAALQDAARWDLAEKYSRDVSKTRVLISTLALLMGSLILGLFKKEYLRAAKGHAVFLKRVMINEVLYDRV